MHVELALLYDNGTYEIDVFKVPEDLLTPTAFSDAETDWAILNWARENVLTQAMYRKAVVQVCIFSYEPEDENGPLNVEEES